MPTTRLSPWPYSILRQSGTYLVTAVRLVGVRVTRESPENRESRFRAMAPDVRQQSGKEPLRGKQCRTRQRIDSISKPSPQKSKSQRAQEPKHFRAQEYRCAPTRAT